MATSWDVSFFLASCIIAIAVGMCLGNLAEGIPLDENQMYVGHSVFTFFRPYPLMVGILTLSLFMMHGTIYFVMKTEGALQEKLKEWVRPAMIFFIISYATTTMVTLIYQTHMTNHIRERPFLFLIALANMLMIANIPRAVFNKSMDGPLSLHV